VRDAARDLTDSGFGVCRIEPGEKLPHYPKWNTYSFDPDDFEDEDSLGIISGPISHGNRPGKLTATCVDLDSDRAVQLGAKLLPYTGMVEGRWGKPHSHMWYFVRLDSIPDENRSKAPGTSPLMTEEYGHPGFKGRSYKVPGQGEVLKLLGTGNQAVVPPSLHPSGQRRRWDQGRRGPAVTYDFGELVEAVEKLALRCGWKRRVIPDTPPPRAGPVTRASSAATASRTRERSSTSWSASCRDRTAMPARSGVVTGVLPEGDRRRRTPASSRTTPDGPG
jgi:hypothetical protein